MKIKLSKKEVDVVISVLSEKLRDLASHISSENERVSAKEGIYLNAIKKVSPVLKKFEELKDND